MHQKHYDERLESILAAGAHLFATKGFRGASMRDLSEATGLSLAGLYYYFDSKDRLLHMILKDVFERVLYAAEEAVNQASTPQERIKALISSHVDYFLAHMHRMKILSHEAENLGGEMGLSIRHLQHRYYKLVRDELDALKKDNLANAHIHPHAAAMGLFGMMNWLYTWYNPQKGDLNEEQLKESLTNIFLSGFCTAQ